MFFLHGVARRREVVQQAVELVHGLPGGVGVAAGLAVRAAVAARAVLAAPALGRAVDDRAHLVGGGAAEAAEAATTGTVGVSCGAAAPLVSVSFAPVSAAFPRCP